MQRTQKAIKRVSPQQGHAQGRLYHAHQYARGDAVTRDIGDVARDRISGDQGICEVASHLAAWS